MYEITTEQFPGLDFLTMSESLPREQVGEFLGRAYQRLFGALDAAGVAPVGPPIARYRVDETAFHVTAGVPFEGEFSPSEPLEVDPIAATTIATTIHRGSYEGLQEAFHAVIEWIAANGFQISGDPWECYLDGPEVAEPRTQVCFPVVAA